MFVEEIHTPVWGARIRSSAVGKRTEFTLDEDTNLEGKMSSCSLRKNKAPELLSRERKGNRKFL